MSIKNKNLKIRLNLQIDKKILETTKVLREKHHINISSLCRDVILKTYNKLEHK